MSLLNEIRFSVFRQPIAAMAGLALILVLFMNIHTQAAEAASGPANNITTFTLKNGLQVVVIPDHRAPVVTHMVWYKVGAADEKPGKSGIAHFLEHLMFKGTKDIAPGEFSKIIARNGGQDNAFTSQDYTAYFQRIARDRLELVMKMEADRMANLTLADKDVLPERDVVLEERRMRTDNDPSSLLSEQLAAAMYLAHPYGKPIIGWENEIARLTRADALNHYNTYYTPNNAILIVAGDITEADLKPLAEKYYGVVARRAEPGKRLRPREPEPRAERRVILRDKKVRLPNMRRTYLTPSEATAKPGEAEALSLLSEILGQGASSRLYKALVVDKKLAANAGAYYSGSNLDSGTFMIYGIPNPGIGVDKVEKAIDKVLAVLLEKGITGDELAHAKRKQVADVIYARDSQSGMARIFGVALTTGLTVKDVLEWPDRLEAVTVDQVNAAARAYLRRKNSTTGILLPLKK